MLSRVLLFATSWTIQSMEFSKQNTGVGILYSLQAIFPAQGSNPGLSYCRRILYQLSHKGSPDLNEDEGKKKTCLFHFKAHVVDEKNTVAFLSLVPPQFSEFDSSLKLEGWKISFPSIL